MTDRYVYYFRRVGPNGASAFSGRRATLETIKGIGEPLMESQIVVDHTEVDDNGFVIGHTDDESHSMDALWTQIQSLERRAHSRDHERLQLSERDDAQSRYSLSLESRVLRAQAQAFRKQRMDATTTELGSPSPQCAGQLSGLTPNAGS